MKSVVLPPGLARPLHEDPRIHGRRWFLLAMMCLSLVLVVMSVSGLVTAIPTMQEELHASASEIQWILDAYAIVFAGALLSAGALGDRFGRKRALLFGLVVFGFGALVAGLASGAGQVIAGRAVMGIGAAFVMPATLSIITTIFPPEERSRAIAGLGRLRRRRRRARPDHLRRAARRVLVGIRGAREPSGRRTDLRGDLDLRAGITRRREDAARPYRRAAVNRRSRSVGVLDHPGRRERLHRRVGARCRRDRDRRPARVRAVGTPQSSSHAAHAFLRGPTLQRRQWRDHDRVLRDVRLLLPRDPVPAVRAWLLAVGSRPRSPAVPDPLHRGVAAQRDADGPPRCSPCDGGRSRDHRRRVRRAQHAHPDHPVPDDRASPSPRWARA